MKINEQGHIKKPNARKFIFLNTQKMLYIGIFYCKRLKNHKQYVYKFFNILLIFRKQNSKIPLKDYVNKN